jgi:hypothetical protein
MARSLTVGQQSAIAAAHHVECLFIEVDFPSGVQRYTTAAAPMTWNGNTWQGGVDPAWLGPIRETEQSESVGLQVRLSGISSAQRSLALNTHMQGRRMTIWFAPMDASTYALLGTPIKEFEGLIDSPEIEDAEDGTMTITVEVESRAARLLRSGVRRWTDRDHQQQYPGDGFCRFTSQTEKVLVWPSAAFFRR